MKKIFWVFKKIIIAFCLIYAFNLVVVGLDIFIPVNIITVSVVSCLGIPGLLALIGVFFILK